MTHPLFFLIKTKWFVLSALMILLCTVGTLGCKKKGCTDPLANNYNPKAKKEDGRCEFTSNIIFWLSKPTRDSNNFDYPLTIRVGGKFVGYIYSGQALNSTPEFCQLTKQTVQHTQTLYDKKISVVITVVDSLETVVVSPINMALGASECLKFKI